MPGKLTFEKVHKAAWKLSEKFRNHYKNCAVCNLPANTRDELEILWFQGKHSGQLEFWLKQRGFEISHRAIDKHFAILMDALPTEEIARLRKLVQTVEQKDLSTPTLENTPVKACSIEAHTKQLTEDDYERFAERIKEVKTAQNQLVYELWTAYAPQLAKLMLKRAEKPNTPLRDLVSAFDAVVRVAQLLSGRPTEHTHNTVLAAVHDNRTEQVTQTLKNNLEALQLANEVLRKRLGERSVVDGEQCGVDDRVDNHSSDNVDDEQPVAAAVCR